MTTAERGNVAEAELLSALTRHGLPVMIPFGGGHPFDLVLHLGEHSFLRVQCKSGRRSKDGCLMFNSCSTDHGRGRRPYTGLADLFGIYCADVPGAYLVPVDEAAGYVTRLRLTPARNNQRSGVRLAAGYEIATWTRQRLQEVLHRSKERAQSEVGSATLIQLARLP